MRLVDVNVLLYASFESLGRYRQARAWLDECLNSGERFGMPWESLVAFVRISSHPRILQPCITVVEAWRQVETWLSQENVWTPAPSPRHAEILGRLVRENQLSHKLIPDAHLAALAIGHGLVLCSADNDFARFRGLRFENPLA